jgi:hypothetical protein
MRKGYDMTTATSNAMQDATVDGFSSAALDNGYTIQFVANAVQDATLATWRTHGFIAAHSAAKVRRDTVLLALARAGVSDAVASELIGANDGAFSQRATTISVLQHAGVDISRADAFDDAKVRERLLQVSWRVVYEARDVVLAAPAGAKAWRALIDFQVSTGVTRRELVVRAREAVAVAAETALASLPDDAPETVRREAERDASRARKAAARAATTAAKSGGRDEHAVGFTPSQHARVSAAHDRYNAGRDGNVTIAAFLVLAAETLAPAPGKGK